MTKSPLIILLCLFLVSRLCYAQEKQLDSLIPITRQLKDSLNIHTAADFIYALSNQEKFESSLQYTNKFITLSQKIQYPKGTGKIYNERAFVYLITDQPYEALKCFDQASIYFEQAGFDRGMAFINNNKAVIEQKIGNPDKSITYLLKSMEYYQKLNDSTSLATTINNIGNVYLDIKDYEKSKKYYYQSLKLKKKYNVTTIGSTLNNLGHALIYQNKLDSATTVLNNSIAISQTELDSRSVSEAYISLGRVSVLKKEYQKAKEYYKSALAVGGKIELKNREIRANLSLADVSMKLGKIKDAEKYITYARQEAINVKSIPLQLSAFEFSSNLYSLKGNFKEAFNWQKKYYELSAEKIANEKSDAILLAQKRLENERKRQAELDKQRKAEQKAKDQLLKQKLYTSLAIIGFALALILIISFIRTRIQRVKYIKKLNRLNQFKNKLFSIVSHDLKNEINGIDKMLAMLKNQDTSKEEYDEVIPVLSDSSTKTSLLLINLLNWSKSQMKELSTKPDVFDMNEIIEEKFDFFSYKAKQKGITLKNELRKDSKVYADKDMIGIVSQNLIANAIKFCKKGDSITIKEKIINNHREILFEDTGVGIPEEALSKLFKDTSFSTYGTNEEEGTGLGLKICNDLILQNKGTIRVTSKLDEGSTFHVTIPMTKTKLNNNRSNN